MTTRAKKDKNVIFISLDCNELFNLILKCVVSFCVSYDSISVTALNTDKLQNIYSKILKF